jgi:hypothetical protein
VDEVDNGVLRVNELFSPDLQEVAFARSAKGCAISCFVPTFLEIIEEGFLSGRSAMRCRIPSSSATNEMVLKQNTDPRRRTILLPSSGPGGYLSPTAETPVAFLWLRPSPHPSLVANSREEASNA